MADVLMTDGVISLDDRPALEAVQRTNTALDSHEQKVRSILDRTGKEWQILGGNVVRVNQNSKGALDNLLRSMERQAQLAGKSGADRMIVERDMLIRKWKDEDQAVKAITRSYEAQITAQRKLEEAQSAAAKLQEQRTMNGRFTGAMQDPVGALKQAGIGIAETLGPLGMAVGAAAVGFTALGAAAWSSMKSLGELGTEISNISIRTGLSTKEVGQFSFAAKAAGSDIGAFETAMKMLSKGLSDGSEDGKKTRDMLSGMGITARDSTGALRPMSDIFLEISKGLQGMEGTANRNAAALAIFGRSGLELLPTMLKLNQEVQRAKELGLGIDENTVKEWEKYHQQMAEVAAEWDILERKFKQPLAAKMLVTLEWITGHVTEKPTIVGTAVNGMIGPMGLLPEASQSYDDLKRAVGEGGIARPNVPAWATPRSPSLDVLRHPDLYAQNEQAPAYAKSVQDAAHLNSLRSAFGATKEGIQEALSQAQKDLKEARAALFAGDLSQEATVNTKSAEVARLRAQLKSAEGSGKADSALNQFRREAAAFEKKGDEAELSAIEKIYSARDLLLKQAAQVKASEAEIAGIRKAADEQAGVISKKAWSEFEKYDQEQAAKRSRGMLDAIGPSKSQMKDAAEYFSAQGRIQDIGVEAQKEELRRRASTESKTAETPEATYNIRISLAVKLAQIELERINNEENSARKMVLAAEAQKDLYTQVAQAQDELNEKRAAADKTHAEELQQQIDELSRTSSGLYQTLFTKPQDFGKQLSGTLHEAMLKPVTEGLGEATARAIHPLIYGTNGQGGIAGAFGGIFGGGKQDPVKLATDFNTTATNQNSMAIANLTTALGGFMGARSAGVAGGSPGGFSVPGGQSMLDTLRLPEPSAAPSAISGGWGISSGTFSGAGFPGSFGGGSTGGFGGGFSLPSILSAGGWDKNAGHGEAMGSPAGKGASSGISGLLKNFKSTNLSGFSRAYTDDDIAFGSSTGSGHLQMTGMAKAAMGAGGSMLANQGLLGSSRGTWGGVAEGTIGGAMVGTSILPGIGTAVGAAVGAGIGLGEKIAGVESPENEAKRLIKELYRINIDNAMARQIVSIAQQKYGNKVSLAVRDPDTRKMLELYAQGTGQGKNMPQSAMEPHAASLVEQGSRLYQEQSYEFGVGHSYSSGLPVLGANPAQPPVNYPSGNQPMTLSVNINGQGAGQFMQGTVSPEFVQAQWSSAQDSSNGRLDNSVMMQYPGLITG